MSGFDEREKGFEAEFKHKADMAFKVTARRNRLLGLWAAVKLGLAGDDAEAYAKTIVDAEFGGGDQHVVDKVVGDLTAKGQTITAAQVRFEMKHFAERARQQVAKE
jgi:hypothetical protein